MLYVTNIRKGVVDMFDQFKELLTYIMNFGNDSGGNIELAFKLAIGAMVIYAGFYFFMKRKYKNQSGHTETVDATAPEKPVAQKGVKTQDTIDGTDLVDKKLVKNLKYHATLDDELKGLVTEQGHRTEDVFALVSDFVRFATQIADELERNEAEFNDGTATSDKYFRATMKDYQVEVKLGMTRVEMSLGELKSVTSVMDLEGQINDGLFLSYQAFYTIPAK